MVACLVRDQEAAGSSPATPIENLLISPDIGRFFSLFVQIYSSALQGTKSRRRRSKSRFLKLNKEHIDYVLESMNKNPSEKDLTYSELYEWLHRATQARDSFLAGKMSESEEEALKIIVVP